MTAVPQLRRRVLPRLDPARVVGGLIGSTALLAVVVMGAIVAIDSAFYRSIVVPQGPLPPLGGAGGGGKIQMP